MTRNRKSLIAGATIAAIGLATAAGISHAGRGDHDCDRGGFGKHGLHHGAGGHGGGGHGQMLFEKFDTNADGQVTRAEVESTRAAKLKIADTNSDGKLSLEEFQTVWLEMTQPIMVDRFQDLDADGSAEITEAEFAQPLAAMFVYLDRDEDGNITVSELRQKHGKHGKHGKYYDDDDHDEDHDDDD